MGKASRRKLARRLLENRNVGTGDVGTKTVEVKTVEAKKEKPFTVEGVGYCAYLTPNQVFCKRKACVIAGSLEAMKGYLSAAFASNADKYTVRATTFDQIFKGMQFGGGYCFDKQAFNEFRRAARKVGMDEGLYDFVMHCEPGSEFAFIGAVAY